MGAAGSGIACPAVVHDGRDAVGRGAGTGQDRVHQKAGLGHGQAGEPQRLPHHEEVGQHDESGMAVPALPAAALVATQCEAWLPSQKHCSISQRRPASHTRRAAGMSAGQLDR